MLPREIIEDIRRKQYGIGLPNDPESKKVIEKLKSILNRALKHLSEDLYSTETHFVLELIQNADDNEYENKGKAFIKFIIDNEKILIQNNEKGFTEKNVRALCDVGNSTKSKILGYIGEKGIGFKSVFRISNTPQIFSNGFQFEFRRNDKQDTLGFVIPYWIKDVPEFIDKKLTNIVLPLREEVKEELSKFNEIEPTLILFLHKLRVIEIHNKNEINKVTLRKEDRKVVIEHPKGKEYYKLVQKSLDAKEIGEQEEKRKNVEETELILAFPLKPDGSADTSKEQKVFAYLPIRAYGFKFIIQADFLLSANREDIHKDKLWNQWLRDNIASVFSMAVEEFKQDEKLKKNYYNYIPLTDEVNDKFFSPVIDQIYSKLRKSECILTESGNWRKPEELLRADKDIRNLISNDDLKNFFNNEYIYSDIKANKAILDALEVPEFKFSHLAQCLQNAEWLKQQSDEWFTRLYSYLNSKKLGERQLEEIKKMKILRLENNELVSAIEQIEQNIFFPLDEKGAYGFEKELRTIKRTILEPKEKEIKESVKEFLEKLGVPHALPYKIIENHILPIYEKGKWKNKDTKVLLGYIRYIKDNLEKYEKKISVKRLRESLYIRVNKTVSNDDDYNHPENIYLSKIYGNKNNLEYLFEGIDVSFVHSCYIESILKDYQEKKNTLKNKLKNKVSKRKKKFRKEVKRIEEQIEKIEAQKNKKIQEWKKFFLKIGVENKPRVILDPNTLRTNLNELLKCYSNKQKSYWADSNKGYCIENDYVCPDLVKVFRKVQKDKVNILIRIFDTEWENYEGKIKLTYWYHRPHTQSLDSDKSDSSFLSLLKNTPWLLNTKGTFAKPSDIFLNKSEIKDLLGDSVPYLAIEIENENFIKALGINQEANVEGVISVLKRLVEQHYQEMFRFKKIYRFINKNYEGNGKNIKNAFSEKPLIYIPQTTKRYFTSKEVIWKDVEDVFGENRGYLEKHYPKLKSFFIEKLDVSEKPNPKDYAKVLEDLSIKEKITVKDEKIIQKIYEELNKHLNPENNEYMISEEAWWNEFIKKPIFWTDKKEFWKNDNNVFINDNEELYKLIKDNCEIAFLKLPMNYYPKIQYFIEAVGISYLSKKVEIEFITEEEPKIAQELTDLVQKFFPYILRYLYQLEHKNYERLKINSILAQFRNLRCYIINNLKVKYILNHQSAIAQRQALLYKGNLYIQKDQVKDTDHLAIELSKLFGEIRGFDDFLISLLDKRSKDKVENFLNAKGIHELPDEEWRWFETLKISPPEKVTITKKEDIKSKEPLPSEPESVVRQSESETPPEPLKKQDWSPEISVIEAPLHGEQFQQAETKPNPKRDKFHDTKSSIDKTSQSSPYEEEQDSDILSANAKKEIGRWGEEYAIQWLKDTLSKKYPNGVVKETEDGFTIIYGEQHVDVHWLNKEKDTGEGHDIKVFENGKEEYIEVKSTKTDNKEWFDLTRKQWDFAFKMKDNFHIYRVFNAGTKQAKLVDIPNPSRLWQEGKLIAYPIRIQI